MQFLPRFVFKKALTLRVDSTSCLLYVGITPFQYSDITFLLSRLLQQIECFKCSAGDSSALPAIFLKSTSFCNAMDLIQTSVNNGQYIAWFRNLTIVTEKYLLHRYVPLILYLKLYFCAKTLKYFANMPINLDADASFIDRHHIKELRIVPRSFLHAPPFLQ